MGGKDRDRVRERQRSYPPFPKSASGTVCRMQNYATVPPNNRVRLHHCLVLEVSKRIGPTLEPNNAVGRKKPDRLLVATTRCTTNRWRKPRDRRGIILAPTQDGIFFGGSIGWSCSLHGCGWLASLLSVKVISLPKTTTLVGLFLMERYLG